MTTRENQIKFVSMLSKSIEQSDRLVDKLASKEIRFWDFQKDIAIALKDSRVTALEIAKGGKDNTYAIDYLTQARHLKNTDYPALKKLFEEISQGKHSPKMIKSRLKGFFLASRYAYESGVAATQESKGLTHAKRILAEAEHCPECIAYAARGARPIGELPLPTQGCSCRFNCKCSLIYGRVIDNVFVRSNA